MLLQQAKPKVVERIEKRVGKNSVALPTDVVCSPGDTDILWRYMDFTKYVALLEEQALFFSRASNFADRFEGSFPLEQTSLSRLQEVIPVDDPNRHLMIAYALDAPNVWESMRKWALVSCWHRGEVESAAMWKLYARSDAAVAIRTTVHRLREALGAPPPVPEGFAGGEAYHFGVVEYIDYQTGHIPAGNFFAPLFRKRRSFEYEREVRVVMLRYPALEDGTLDSERMPEDSGTAFPVDRNVLVEAVFVAPEAPHWYSELVQKVSARYGLTAAVVQSSLDAKPLY